MNSARNNDRPPPPNISILHNWALFLDLDGTLLDLAPTPESVVVSENLIEILAALETQLSGALAIVSGRPLASIDRLLHPLCLTAAAEHGAVLRETAGLRVASENGTKVPSAWRAEIHRQVKAFPGMLVEEKEHGVAVHYRENQEAAPIIGKVLERLVAQDPAFEILPALMALELRHRSVTKGTALTRLMVTDPFRHRRPLYIGDDVTDEDGIAAAIKLGGMGLRVSETFAGAPAKVRRWLEDQLTGR